MLQAGEQPGSRFSDPRTSRQGPKGRQFRQAGEQRPGGTGLESGRLASGPSSLGLGCPPQSQAGGPGPADLPQPAPLPPED